MPATTHTPAGTTYAEVRARMSRKDRILCILGDVLDRVMRAPGAPIFPKDAILHRGNCGVVATAMLLDIPYADAARELGHGGTTATERTAAMHRLGAKPVEEKVRGRTLGQLAAATAGKPGRAMVRVHRHAVVIWDGLIFDQNFPAGALPSEHFAARQVATDIARLA